MYTETYKAGVMVIHQRKSLWDTIEDMGFCTEENIVALERKIEVTHHWNRGKCSSLAVTMHVGNAKVDAKLQGIWKLWNGASHGFWVYHGYQNLGSDIQTWYWSQISELRYAQATLNIDKNWKATFLAQQAKRITSFLHSLSNTMYCKWWVWAVF